MTISLLVVGLAGSAVAGLEWARYQSTQNERSFRNTATGVTQSVKTALQRDLDFQSVLQQLVATTPGLTNHQLAPWLLSLNLASRYPGSIGFGFDARVPADQLDAWEAAVTSDPGVGSPPGPYPLFPPGPRAVYCLARLGIQVSPAPTPPGLDLCAPSIPGLGPSPLPDLFQRVASTSQTEAYALASALDSARKNGVTVPPEFASLRDMLLVVSPVYAGGSIPGSPSARQQALTGWMVGTYSAKSFIASGLGTTSDVAVKVTTASGSVLASGGAAVGGAHSSFTTPAQIGLLVTVGGPTSSAPLDQGVVLGLVGAALTAVLALLFVHMGRSRDSALRMVDLRTGQLRHQALHDALTGLPNRDLLFDRASQMMARAQRLSQPAAALYLDLDNFKDVNDSFGHLAGDELLKAVAERIAATVRKAETVGRLGGDEFLILTESDSEDARPDLVAERILSVIAEPFELHIPGALPLSVSASIGIATGIHTSAEELIRDADVALYQAKEAGKARFVIFNPEMQTAVQDRLSLEMDLQHALDNHELFVMYQPIFDLNTMSAKSVEALVRWRHPSRGVLDAAEFIPIAEQSGLIVAIGRFVLKEACGQAVAWSEAGYEINISVNVSARELESDGYVDEVATVFEQTGLPAQALTLEVTESMLMRDITRSTSVLNRLKALGVSIAIDDFGTGYSSLAYLRQFPIDSLKIDRSFIAKAGRPQYSALVHTLVQLGKALEIETLAEGIEDNTQLTRLQQERCDSGQGFLFARPLHPDALIPFFTATSTAPVRPHLETTRDP